jgi:hypothetical protein
VLTLFEYLRRRAFDAVIDGTQDALEFLESPKSLDQTEAAEDALARRRPGLGSQQNSSGEETADSDAGDGDKKGRSQPSEHLPPPRRRGRPRKNEQPKS